MKNNLNNPKEIFLKTFKEYSKEDLIKEIMFNQKEIKSQDFETKKMLLKISSRLNVLVFIAIICILIMLLFN